MEKGGFMRIFKLEFQKIMKNPMLWLLAVVFCLVNCLIIPFNRQELADYLGVDRSALSNELGKMRKEGMIEVNRNQIHYLEQED